MTSLKLPAVVLWVVVVVILLLPGLALAETLGYTTIGASTNNLDANQANSTQWTAGTTGEIESISLYINDLAGGHFKGVIWDADDGTVLANGVAPAYTDDTGWQTAFFVTKPTLTSGHNYLIGYVQSGDTSSYKYDAGTANDSYYDLSNNYTTPEINGKISNAGVSISTYVTYSATGSESATTTEPSQVQQLQTNQAQSNLTSAFMVFFTSMFGTIWMLRRRN